MSNSGITIIVKTDKGLADEILSDEQTFALARFVQRLSWYEMRACAEDEEEIYLIRSAIGKLYEVLKRIGYDSR